MSRPSCDRKIRGWKPKVLLFLGGGLTALLLVEGTLRVLGVSHPTFHQADELAGLRLIPGAKGLQTSEGRAWVHINSDGWRDRERVAPKPPRVFRIAVLGDSYAEALQVELEETFWAVAEKALNDPPTFSERRVEFLNFGVAGYGTGQQLLTLRHRVWKYAPDAVLLAFLTGNDVSDNAAALKRVDYVPYFVWDDEGLQLDESFKESAGFRSRNSWGARAASSALRFSHAAQLLNQARLEWRRSRIAAAPRKPPPEGATRAAASQAEQGLDFAVYREPVTAEWKKAWRVTEALLAELHSECQRHDSSFLVATLSNGLQVGPDSAARADFAKEAGVPDLFYPDRRIQRVCARAGVPVLSLAPILNAYAGRTGTHLHGFDTKLGKGHWNEHGHRVAGEALADWLRPVLESISLDDTSSE